MDQPDKATFDRLSPRMRDCLRLAYDRKTNKEIALLHNLSEGTVKGYIADAVRLLGARGKVDAAEMLHRHEAPAPSIVEGSSGGVSPAAGADPALPQPDAPWWRSLPIRRKGALHNDLSVRQRLAWIFAIAIGIALGVSAVGNVLAQLDALVRR